MISPQLHLKIHPEIIVDNFAGGGGASTGIELALGRPPDHAINHDAEALGMHRINHPQTVHHCEDIFDVDPAELTKQGPIGFVWFSPDCKHFSVAKGGKPLNKKIRGLVLVMLRYAAVGARVMAMENVREIETWGPLLPNGKVDPEHKGRTWKAFLAALGSGLDSNHPDMDEIVELLRGKVTREQIIRGFGYKYDYWTIRAHNHGAGTIRKRLYMVARNDGRPIVCPKPTHEDPKLRTGLKPWHTMFEYIDWSLPCPSIFLNKRQARKIGCRRPLAKSTMRRIAHGIWRYILDAENPVIVSLTSNVGFITEHANATHQRNIPIDEPGRTICAEVKGGHFALVSGSLVSLTHQGGERVEGLDKPSTTITGAHRGEKALARATLPPFMGQTGHLSSNSKMVKAINAPMRCQCARPEHFMAAAHLTKFTTGSTGSDLRKPVGVITAGSHSPETHGGAASVHGLVAANIVKLRGEAKSHAPGHALDEPGHTTSAGGQHHAVSMACLAAYYGCDKDGQRIDAAGRTITCKERFGFVKTDGIYGSLTAEQIEGARRVAKFLRSHGVKFEGEFATVGEYVIVDIGLRMLAARELFLAQGFPPAYEIEYAMMVNPKTGEVRKVKLTKEIQIRMVGNSVSPPVARDIVAANVPELSIWNQKDKRRFARQNRAPVQVAA